MSRSTDKQALSLWDEFRLQIENSTPVDTSETEAEKQKRIKWLEKPGNHEEWFKYYFPKYCFSEPADFHKRSTNKLLKSNKMFQCRAWARGLSKSTRRMFEVFYITFVKKHPTYAILISKSGDNAEQLLAPYKLNLEANQRLINDYGEQQRTGKWEGNKFTTRKGVTFRGVGTGQNPRGAKEEEIRANMLIFDDADDDEVCRNIERLDKIHEWVERAVMPTVDIAKDFYIFWDNNIIAEDSLALRAQPYADDVSRVNIRDDKGISTWLEKNSEEQIDYMLSKISYASGQAEYFNNPVSTGKTFPEITWGKCPQLRYLAFALVYADPATSNKDRPSLKSKVNNSAKCVQVLGYKDNKYYVYKCWLDNMGNSTFIDWLYQARDYVGEKTALYTYIENNTLQNPFYEQVLLPLLSEKGNDHPRGCLMVTPDTREKPDKWVRIEANLEPLNRFGNLVFNINEKDDPHMKRLETQFKTAKPASKLLDGPDTTEGGVHLIKEKIAVESVGGIQTFGHRSNSKRL
jgi:hypothetical protein